MMKPVARSILSSFLGTPTESEGSVHGFAAERDLCEKDGKRGV
ncbi:MAG: hypothetical protein ACLSFW_05415 [Bacteroides cellulosilyticus]